MTHNVISEIAVKIATTSLQLTGGPPGDRTQNPRIKSPLLCLLS
jgi:hypothetical protein